MVPEEDDEEGLSQGAPQPQPSAPKLQQQSARSAADGQQQHSQQMRPAHGGMLHEEQAESMQVPTASGLHVQSDMPSQSYDAEIVTSHQDAIQEQHNARLQETSRQHQTSGNRHDANAMQHECQPSEVIQQALPQQQTRQPLSPRTQTDLGCQTAEGSGPTPSQPQQPVISPARAAANRPVPLRAGAKAPATRTSPGMAHAVEHSSLSLSELAGVTRSRLRPPSNLNSPPKRAGKAVLPKQATNSHLVKLAAAVPLPASPDGAGKLAFEPTAAAALATAVAKPSHIPAPAVKASRLKKPTNTSGFFSSGRSFTGGASNSRYIALIGAVSLATDTLLGSVTSQHACMCTTTLLKELYTMMTGQT